MKKHPLLATVLLLLLAALVPLMSGCNAITNQVNATLLSTGTDGYTAAAQAADEAIAAITRSPDIEVPSNLKNPGQLTIASDAAYPPLEYLAKVTTKEGDKTSDITTLVGFEVDLYTAVAKKLGLEPVYVQISFSNLPGILVDGDDVDMAASGMITSPELLAKFLASDIYLPADLAICTASGAQLSDEASLQGKIVGVQAGSTAESVAESIEGIAELRLFPHVAGAFTDLKGGVIDALIVVEPVAEWILNTDDYTGALVISGLIPTNQGFAFWCNKSDQALMDAVNAALRELMQAPESPQETTTTAIVTGEEGTTTTEGASTTTVEGGMTSTTEATNTTEQTTDTETATATTKSVYELILEKWGLTAD